MLLVNPLLQIQITKLKARFPETKPPKSIFKVIHKNEVNNEEENLKLPKHASLD